MVHISCAFTIQQQHHHYHSTQRNKAPLATVLVPALCQRRNSYRLNSKDTGDDTTETMKEEVKMVVDEKSHDLLDKSAETVSLSVDNTQEESEDSDEWEYEEFEFLSESDFYSSEWKVGTLMDDKKNEIEETWCRLLLQDGEFVCIWGDGAKGKWNFDKTSQFLSMSKDTFGGWLGKQIWAGGIDDFYYLQGTVRGWSPISPASVVGQWQAKRLGISKDEDPGVAPWFQANEEDNDSENLVSSSEGEESAE